MSLALDFDLQTSPTASASDALEAAVRQACERISPVWPLSRFVAVNPFLGFADMSFDRAAGELRRLTGLGRANGPHGAEQVRLEAQRERHIADADEELREDFHFERNDRAARRYAEHAARPKAETSASAG